MTLLFAKLAVSIGVVLGLSWLAERAGPRVAGVLSGYPLGTAMLLYFIGIEQGVAFASESAIYSMPGLIATLAFMYAYFQMSRRICDKPVVLQIILSSGAAFAAFVAVSWICQHFEFTLITAALTLFVAMMVAIMLFRGIENAVILRRVRLTKRVVVFRAATAAFIVLAISGAAALIGPRWAGLFSGFPVTLYPMILIIHFSYGVEPVHTLIRNFPRGMGALLVYIVAVTLSYPVIGIGAGTLLAFGVATFYLVLYTTFVWWRYRGSQA
ncbi:MAG: hypothetical protein ABID63_02055 [Pseudomonadota bacterium]